LLHAEQYVRAIIKRFNLNANSHVIEVAANDGYLLQYIKAEGIPCIGIEPTTSTANAARRKGIPIIEDFFGVHLAKNLIKDKKHADIIIANNVLAHVPDINDFISGFALLLKPHGVATFEFPHLIKLVHNNQFDTIYHEHFSYLSLTSVRNIFHKNGLSIFDVEELPTHGGSLRVFAQRLDREFYPIEEKVQKLLHQECYIGIQKSHFYLNFQLAANKVKYNFLNFLLEAKRKDKCVVAYGAAAKGNTFINYAGIRSDLINVIIDKNPLKQGKYMPGSRIPIVSENYLENHDIDYIIILPWNLKSEIIDQLKNIKSKKSKFIIAIPSLEILPDDYHTPHSQNIKTS
jgi:SAM-dependent methyltransferase